MLSAGTLSCIVRKTQKHQKAEHGKRCHEINETIRCDAWKTKIPSLIVFILLLFLTESVTKAFLKVQISESSRSQPQNTGFEHNKEIRLQDPNLRTQVFNTTRKSVSKDSTLEHRFSTKQGSPSPRPQPLKTGLQHKEVRLQGFNRRTQVFNTTRKSVSKTQTSDDMFSIQGNPSPRLQRQKTGLYSTLDIRLQDPNLRRQVFTSTRKLPPKIYFASLQILGLTDAK